MHKSEETLRGVLNASDEIIFVKDLEGRYILTDIVFPGLNGRELAEKLTSSKPELKVLYMSGYSENVIFHREILEKGLNFLKKPFTPQELALKIKEALSS